MISTTDKPVLARQIKVMDKCSITEISTFRSFQKDKTDREWSKLCLAEHCPVYFTLMVRNIEPMHPIARRKTYAICLCTIARLPSVCIRTDKEIIKPDDQQCSSSSHQNIIYPRWNFPLTCYFLFILAASGSSLRSSRRSRIR